MELCVLDEKKYLDYALKCENISIMQLPNWGKLKEDNGWKYHLVGLVDNNNILGVTLLLEKNTPIKKSLYYSPRGYLVDVEDFDLLKTFHEKVIEYVKNNNGFLLKVDPNVIYARRDSEGNLIDTCGEKAFNNFKKLGFKHLGFTKDFENLQPRFLCRFKLLESFEDTFNTFSKSTRKNTEKAIKMGVKVRTIDTEEIDLFVSILKKAAEDDHFILRPASYYKKMYELFKDYMKLYITYIDTEEYYNNVSNELNNTIDEIKELDSTMKKINVGEKIKNKMDLLNKKKDKLKTELDYASNLKKEAKQINIGALMSTFLGNEGITHMSGTDHLYKDFNPKYAYYNQHIIDAIDSKMTYVNFYGISGNLDKNSEYYNIYEIKKGYNPEVIELLGEFDYIINPITYNIYKLALKIYKLKKIIKK